MSLPPPPLQAWPAIPPVWRRWFRDLFVRAGESEATPLNELEERLAAVPERSGLGDRVVTTATIADRSVTTAKIADVNVTTAKIADDAVTGTKLGIPGLVFPFAGSTVPDGMLLCDGQAVSRTTYAALFAVVGTTYGVGDGSTTFNVPELRGEFVRGLDAGRGVDAARALGSAQAASFESHTHTDVTGGALGVAAGALQAAEYVADAQTGATGGTETRPRNVALNYVITT